MSRIAGLIVWLLVLCAAGANAHEVRPGFLELREVAAHEFLMTWKVPALGALHLGIEPRLPGSCQPVTAPISLEADGAFIEHSHVRCEGGLAGQTIAIDGLDATLTDVLVRVETTNGGVSTARLTPSSPRFDVPVQPRALQVVRAYVGLGVEHILFGIDHLLFVFCLLLLVRRLRTLLTTITAFTLAHSITLALATLGFVHVSAAPVEATIALSIVFLASELAQGETGRSATTRKYPWLIAFSFGLLHGLGFAGALAEIGLPHGEIPLALFSFNVGVELGQLAFVLAVLSIGLLLRSARIVWPIWAPRAAAYAVGSTAACWVFTRIAAAT